jgi:hypothetical protein
MLLLNQPPTPPPGWCRVGLLGWDCCMELGGPVEYMLCDAAAGCICGAARMPPWVGGCMTPVIPTDG